MSTETLLYIVGYLGVGLMFSFLLWYKVGDDLSELEVTVEFIFCTLFWPITMLAVLFLVFLTLVDIICELIDNVRNK